VTTRDGNRFDVQLHFRTGPRVRVWGDASPDQILAELPAGWTIRDEDWQHGVRTYSDAMVYRLTRKQKGTVPPCTEKKKS
jgi:hypothetical protein